MLSAEFIASQQDRLRQRLVEYRNRAPLTDYPGAVSSFPLKRGTSIPFILAALERISQGTYGICADCLMAIPEKRLLLVPGAIRCAACQATEENCHAEKA